MNLLVCIGGETYSKGTVQLAADFARRLKADLSVLYVGPQISQLHQKEVQIAKEKLGHWMIETPEMKVLNSALEILRQMDFLKVDAQGELNIKHSLRAGISGAFEFHLYGSGGQNVRFRYRAGEIVDNIRKEAEQLHYDLVFVGASQKRRLVHRILQFVPTSSVIVKREATNITKFLVCVKKSQSSRAAVWFTIQIARQLRIPVQFLAIDRRSAGSVRLTELAERYMKVCRRYKIPCSSMVRTGGVQEVIEQVATPEHLVVLGSTRTNELIHYFFGSLPIRISQSVNSSVLVVKEEEHVRVRERQDLEDSERV
ncbi:MAG TPA: universal stress protein [Acidobacteriota bacterium]|jgi:nucleotide-binding universal stress UspA family protein